MISFQKDRSVESIFLLDPTVNLISYIFPLLSSCQQTQVLPPC